MKNTSGLKTRPVLSRDHSVSKGDFREGATRIHLLSLLPNLQREVSHFTVGCRNGEAQKMHNLRKNIGKAERTGRIIAGALLLLFTLSRALTVGLTTTAIIFGVGGILLLGTSLVGY
jgi:hypothetical protein